MEIVVPGVVIAGRTAMVGREHVVLLAVAAQRPFAV
jgi:hypothetical protein